MKKARRKTTRYHIKGKHSGEILHRGQTSRTLKKRHREHKKKHGKNTRIVKIGRKVLRKTALKWERDGGKRI